MAVYNIYVVSKTMAGKDTTQDANRSHDADNYTWVVSNGKSHQYYYNTTAPAGKANFHIESTLSTVGDEVFMIKTGVGNAVEVKGDRSAYFRGNAYFGLNCFMEVLKNPFFPSTTIQLQSNIVTSTVGIKAGEYTTAQRLALNVATLEGILVWDTDTNSYWYSNGTIWVSVGKPAEFTTAQRLALNISDYRTITVFDSDTNSLWFSDGTNWVEL